MAATRVAVFIDWQNIFMGARKAFGLKATGPERGNVDPLKIGSYLAAGNGRGDAGELIRVEIFRGLPKVGHNPKGHSANRRQAAAWKNRGEGIVIPNLRPLKYPSKHEDDQRPREKGVDVHLAVRAVEMSLLDECDVAIIFSHDSDLRPAVDAIERIKGPRAVETASWWTRDYRYRISTKGLSGLHHHSLNRDVFLSVEDPNDYALERD